MGNYECLYLYDDHKVLLEIACIAFAITISRWNLIYIVQIYIWYVMVDIEIRWILRANRKLYPS